MQHRSSFTFNKLGKYEKVFLNSEKLLSCVTQKKKKFNLKTKKNKTNYLRNSWLAEYLTRWPKQQQHYIVTRASSKD